MVPFQVYNWFCEHLIPLHTNKIHAVTLKNKQLNFFSKYIHQLHHLQCLTLINDNKEYEKIDDRLNFYLDQLNHFPYLIELNITVSVDLDLAQILERIDRNARSTLTSLTILSSSNYSYDFYNLNQSSIQMAYVKFLKIHIYQLDDLICLFRILINLEELKLSVLDFNEYKEVKEMIIPKSLIKLHFEVGGLFELNRYLPDLTITKRFLSFFNNQLETLVLIIDSDDEQFTDSHRFQTLTDGFSHLKSFQYSIRTPYRPLSGKSFEQIKRLPDNTFIIFTNPCPLSFADKLRHNHHGIHPKFLQLEELYNVTDLALNSSTAPDLDFNDIVHWTFELSSLRQITYSTINPPTSKQMDILSRLLTSAPNVRMLQVSTENSKYMFSLLRGITVNSLKTITHLEYFCDTQLNSSFFAELVQLVPQLINLYLSTRWNYENNDRFLTPKLAVDHIKKYFKHLIDLKMRLFTQNKHDQRYLQIFLELLNNQQKEGLYYVDYHKKQKTLHLWL